MKIIRKGLPALMLVASFCNASAQAPAAEIHRFGIKECVAYAHEHSTQVKNAMIDLQIQQQTNKSITAGALPTLTASGSTTDFFQTPVTLIPGGLFPNTVAGKLYPVSFQPQYNAGGTLQLTQTLFDGQVFVGLQARKASIDYARKAIDITDEAIRVNVYKIYYQLLVSRTQMELIDANIARADKLLKDATIMFQNGFLEKLDVDKSTVQLANLQTLKLTTQSSIDNGYLGLKFLLGMPIKDSLVLTGTFNEANLKSGVLTDSAYNYDNRNDYQFLQITKKLNEYNIKRYKFSYLPTINLVGAFQENAYNNEYNFFSKNGNWYATSYGGLSINLPLFSGFAKNANLQKAKLQLLQTQNQIENLKISIDNDVSQSQNQFRAAITTMDFQKKNMALAESVYEQTKKKYESGLASSTDVTNAQTDFITAQTNYINALYDAVIAKVNYNKAIGRL